MAKKKYVAPPDDLTKANPTLKLAHQGAGRLRKPPAQPQPQQQQGDGETDSGQQQMGQTPAADAGLGKDNPKVDPADKFRNS